MNTIIFTIVVALIIGFVLGILLGLFKKIFAVKVDPKVSQIREVLSGGNCGGCGFAGCDAFAAAVASGSAPANGCVAGGPGVADAISKILGVSALSAEKKSVVLACQGNIQCAAQKGIYNGVQSCRAAQIAINGTKICAYGCIGLGDCVKSCPFGALSMDSQGLPVVNYEKCVGCGKCAKVCPKKLFSLFDVKTKGPVALCSCKSDNKVQIKKDCAKGCFKCGLCAKKCPESCIDVSSGIPEVDYKKCTACGTCVSSCPDKVLVMAQEIFK